MVLRLLAAERSPHRLRLENFFCVCFLPTPISALSVILYWICFTWPTSSGMSGTPLGMFFLCNDANFLPRTPVVRLLCAKITSCSLSAGFSLFLAHREQAGPDRQRGASRLLSMRAMWDSAHRRHEQRKRWYIRCERWEWNTLTLRKVNMRRGWRWRWSNVRIGCGKRGWCRVEGRQRPGCFLQNLNRSGECVFMLIVTPWSVDCDTRSGEVTLAGHDDVRAEKRPPYPCVMLAAEISFACAVPHDMPPESDQKAPVTYIGYGWKFACVTDMPPIIVCITAREGDAYCTKMHILSARVWLQIFSNGVPTSEKDAQKPYQFVYFFHNLWSTICDLVF